MNKLPTILLGVAVVTLVSIAMVMSPTMEEQSTPSVFVLDNQDISNDELLSHYEKWQAKYPEHNKKPTNFGILLGDSLTAESDKLEAFKANMKLVSEHNKQFLEGKQTFSMHLNQFAHLSPEEFECRKQFWLHLSDLSQDESIPKRYRQEKPKQLLSASASDDNSVPFWKSFTDVYSDAFKSYFPQEASSKRPASIDWRNKMNPPLAQGACGSCYTFASTAAIQAIFGLKENLSTQELLDCDGRNNGCKGGLPQKVFSYTSYKGISTERDYPYLGHQQPQCKVNYDTTGSSQRVKTSSYYDVEASYEALETALQHSPVATAMDSKSLQMYESGIYDYPCSVQRSDANHAVLVVGYTPEYFIIRNSWGPHWGEDGYFKVKKVHNEHGVCGIYNDMSYPTKE